MSYKYTYCHVTSPHQRLYDFTWWLHARFHDLPNNRTCWEEFSRASYDAVLGNPLRDGVRECVTPSLGVLSLYIYEANTKFRRAPIPTDWHDSGILGPNAAVLIAVFALRLSAGGECHVCQVRGGRRRTEEG